MRTKLQCFQQNLQLLIPMDVSLTPELEKIVAERIASGGYGSASDVIGEALRLLEEHDRLTELRDVSLGLDN